MRELSNLMDRFSTLFAGQCLGLNQVPANLLPKGLATIQAERCSTPPPLTLQSLPLQAEDPLVALLEPEASGLAFGNSDNEVENIIMLAQGLSTLPAQGISLKERLADIEKDLICQALNRTDGNVSQTARLLNLQRTTLIEKINKYELRPNTSMSV